MDIFYMCLFCKYLNSLCGYVKQNAELSPKLLEKNGKNCKSCFMPYFIDSREPLATAFAKWLVSHFEMELSSTPPSACATVIVPTHTAAELLRGEFIAELLRKGKGGATDLKFTTLESEISDLIADSKVLKGIRNLSIWTDILSKVKKGEFESIFPSGLPTDDDRMAFARKIASLQSALAENLHTISSASKILSQSADSQKWEDLALLERRYFAVLRAQGFPTRAEALEMAFEKLRKSGRKYIAVGFPDVSGIFRRFARCALRFETAVYAPNRDSEFFDEFGAPVGFGSRRLLGIEDDSITVCQSVAEEAGIVADLAGKYGSIAHKVLAVACEQNKAAPVFKAKLEAKGFAVAPLNVDTLAESALGRLLQLLGQISEGGDFNVAGELCKNPYFSEKYLPGENADELLLDFDALFSAAIPGGTNAALDFLLSRGARSAGIKNIDLLGRVLRAVSNFEAEISNCANPAEWLASEISLMAEAYFSSNRAPNTERAAFKIFSEAAKELSGCPENVFTFADCVKIFIQRLASDASGGAGNPGDIRLLDWIDIFWSPNPHVVLSDMNDGIVPLAEPQTFLLSDSSRKILGLRNSESRRSRDAYMLWALKRSRSEPGRKLSIIVPRKNIDSDPLMPSPILMCEADLPGRVKMLFKDLPSGSRNAHFLPLWKFSAKKTPYSRPFSPSALKTYISSPWVFYLKYVLKAEIFDSEKEEMDAAQFGTLFHSVMERFAKSAVADSTDWAEIFSFMSERLDALSKAEFGRSQRMQVRMQIENLRNRLGSVARVQARRRAEGWKISETEVPFEFSEGGRRFAGRIDRIDVRENSENSPEYAVLDYKTADKVSPDYVEREHLSNKGEWKNLQLPLYVRAAADIYPGRKISCGYFLVPKDLSQTGVQMWDNFSDELLASAMQRALEIADKISSENFSPEGNPPFYEFSDVFGFTHSEMKDLTEFDR